MIILHTCWIEGRLYLWGECEAAAAFVRAPEGGAPPLSPFDPGPERLRGALERAAPDAQSPPAATRIALGLPTQRSEAGARPLPSSAFLGAGAGERAAAGRAEAPHPWRVSALDLPWKTAFTLLGRCKERRLDDGLFAAADLLGFALLFRYAGALVARGRFLPDLRDAPDARYEARWRPALDREEDRRLDSLAARLPPSARGGLGRRHVAEAFLEEMVDRLVRFSVVTTLTRAQAERGRPYSAHDAWFAALRGDARTVRWPEPQELRALADQLELWRRPVVAARRPDEQVELRLHEPAAPEQPWFLQAAFRTAATVPPGENPLFALGQAAMLFPPLGEADFHPQGLGCPLSAQEAHAFLAVSSGLLTAAGFEVRLPAWWQQEGAHVLALEADVSPHLPPGAPAAGAAAGDDAPRALSDEKVDVRWSVTLNGEPVSADELAGLLRAQSPLVYFRGRWLVVDARQLQHALRVGRKAGSETHSALDVVRLALGGNAAPFGLGVSVVRGSGWLDPLLKRLYGGDTFENLPAPEGFCGELRPYQVRGFSWLCHLRDWGFGACLADDMGLGKTVQALAFLLHEKARRDARPALLVAPMSVLENWQREARRFAPGLRCRIHHGPGRSHGEHLLRDAHDADLVITSYNLLYRDYADLRQVPWSGLLLDEAQNIKNPDTRQAQAARALQADYRVTLTGTPLENHVGDLWSILDFLNPGMLGRRAAFRESFFRPIQAGADPGARTRLKRLTDPFILRRLKTDKQVIADLPEKIEAKVYCPLTLEQARLYEEELAAFRREVELAEGISRRGLILAVLTRLKQICNHPAHYLGQPQALPRRSGKLVRLEEMLDELFERRESALVFTQYAEMGHLLQRHLCRTYARDMPFLHGGVPRKERDRLVRAFQESEEPLAFVLSLKAGGTGLNLTRATHVFHYDRWWNPAVENQATDRAFRIGQTRNVLVHKFICGGTLEDRIDAMLEAKTALANEIVTSGEAFLTELSNAELHELLGLDTGQPFWQDETERSGAT